MTITVDATYENETLKLSAPLPLREHQKVRVTVEPQGQAGTAVAEAKVESAGPSLAEEIEALIEALPPGALDNLPDDLAAEHDHYLYGTPKRFG